MRDATQVGYGIGAIRRAWRAMGLWWKVGILLAGVLLVGFGAIRVSRWWTEWPARLVLPTTRWSRPWAFSPDGSTLATIFNGTRDELTFWDPADGRKRSGLVDHDKRHRFAGTFSPDGRTLASPWVMEGSGRNFSVDLVDVAAGEIRATFPSPDGGFVGLRYREGGATIRLISTDSAASTLSTTDVDAGSGRARPVRTLSCPVPRSFMDVSEDGRSLALASMAKAAGGPTTVTIWDLEEDREALTLPPIPARMIAHAIRFAPDGATLALGLEDGSIQLWDLAARRLRSTLPAPRANYSPLILTFSPDGSTLASFNHFSNRVASFDLARMLIAAHLRDDDNVMQSELVLLDVATGRPRIRTPWEGATVFAPDGRSVATSHQDSRVRIHDLPARPGQSGGH